MQRADVRRWLMGDDAFVRSIGLTTRDGALYKAKEAKFEEIVGLVEQVVAVTRELSTRRTVTVLDLACGKSYASFAIYHVLASCIGRPVRVIGVDTNERLVDLCRATASRHDMDMAFHACRCTDLVLEERPDVAVSLHACDTASDEALAAAVRLSARRVLVVPCCHRELKRKMEHHPFRPLTQFAVCNERLAEMATDAMRALLLRAVGYEVDMVEFVPLSVTPKNLMIRGKWRSMADARAPADYVELRDSLGGGPLLEHLLRRQGSLPMVLEDDSARPLGDLDT